MNVLIEIGHPAHVHFFRGVIAELEALGHRVVLATRNKEITNRLLDDLGRKYTTLSTPASSKAGLLLELVRRWWAVWRLLGRERIEAAASISGISTALPARLRGVPNLTVTDTEDAKLSNYLSFPFSDWILTPEFFLLDLGPKQIRYRGLHELAYLRNFDFDGLEARLAGLGLRRPFSIIRLIAFDAVHDWGLRAGSKDEIGLAIETLSAFGSVYLTSQKPLPESLRPYELKIPLSSIHDVLAGAEFFLGESPTMAVEAGLLGTPTSLISSRSPRLGNMVHLERLGLLKNFATWGQALDHLASASADPGYRRDWAERAAAFRADSVDVTRFLTQAILDVAQGRRPDPAAQT